MATQIGPKIGIEGEKEYRQQLQQITQATKTLDSEMKKVTAEWNENTSALSKNRASAQNTAAKLELFNQRLEVQNALLAQSVEKFGASSAAAQKYQQAVNNTQATIASLNNTLKTYKGAEAFSDMSVKMADIGTKMQNVGQSMTAIGQKLTTSVTVPIVALSSAAIKFGSDLEESANKTDVVFGTMSKSVRDFAQTTTDAYAISEGKALEMASDYGAIATSMGFSQREAAKLSTSLVGLAGDMASFHNKSVDVAANSLKGVFTGETEALKSLNVVMTQSTLKEYAASQGKVYDAMSQSEKVMLRYNYIMQNQKDAIGDAQRTMGGFAGSTRQLKAAFQDAAAGLGEALIPLVTPLVQALTFLLQKFNQLPGPVKTFVAAILLIAAAIGPVVLILGSFVGALSNLITGIPMIAAKLAELAAAFGLVDVAAAPVIGIILAIAAACAVGFAAGWELAKHWDDICEAAGRLADSVREAYNNLMSFNDNLKNNVNGAINDIASYFASLPGRIINALKDAVQAIKDEFKNMINNAKKSGADFVSGFIDGIKSKVQKLINQVKEIAETIEEYLGFSCPDKGALSKYESWMPDFMMGLAKGINQNKGIVTRAIASLSKDMVLPLDANASMNMAIAGANGGSVSVGGTSMNVYVDHINDLQDLIRIQNQAQQRYRMGAR